MNPLKELRTILKAWYLDYCKRSGLEDLELKFAFLNGATNCLIQDMNFLERVPQPEAHSKAVNCLELIVLLGRMVEDIKLEHGKAVVVKMESGTVFSYKTVDFDPAGFEAAKLTIENFKLIKEVLDDK